jgi:hypothetical protein
MPGPWHMGNDIVDLADPRARGKSGDERFLRRVFSQEERDTILASGHPDLALWVRWAAKEAAFKTVSKATGAPPILRHLSFRVSLPALGASGTGELLAAHAPLDLAGAVRHEGSLLALRVRVTDNGVHALTWLTSAAGGLPAFTWEHDRGHRDPVGWRERTRGLLTDREWSCVTHEASALTRLAARRALASALSEPEGQLEIGCGPGSPGRRIPIVFLRGREIAVDLTLSHHGALLAWAFIPV